MENEKPLTDYPEEIRGYIKELREEAKENRIKLSEFEKQSNEFKSQQETLLAKEREEKEAKEKELTEKLAKQNEFQKLYEMSQNKIKELENYKNEYDKIQSEIESERQLYIKKLPLEKREIYKDMPLKVIKDVVETISKSNLDYSAGAETNFANNGEADFDKMTPEQVEQAISSNSAMKASYDKYVAKQLNVKI